MYQLIVMGSGHGEGVVGVDVNNDVRVEDAVDRFFIDTRQWGLEGAPCHPRKGDASVDNVRLVVIVFDDDAKDGLRAILGFCEFRVGGVWVFKVAPLALSRLARCLCKISVSNAGGGSVLRAG